MRDAQTYLETIRDRGERRLELRRVYRNLRNKELFLRAYAKLYANEGALTPGIDPTDTVDGMSLKRMDSIIADLKAGTYRWKPSRRRYIPKKNGKLRALGMPGWKDKLLQEVIRSVLSAYYEPQFSETSHGFRPGRGCHTALRSIGTWRGTTWFIEGDIRGCFDEIEHEKLLGIISRDIKDQRLLKLLKGMLKAGYLEDWKYHQTYSGTPQGGTISPLLANIFLNELDKYVEEELIPHHTRGNHRHRNPEYERLTRAMIKAKKQGDIERYKALEKQRRELPSGDPNDPNYRRLRYCRYADDFLLGFIGPKSEALEIKRQLGEFL
jgi:group II intron reverse transcriptase/maturase